MENENISNIQLYNLLQEIGKDNKEIKRDVKQIREDILNQNKKVEELTKVVEDLKVENRKLTEKLQTVEGKIKKYNLIIFGITEEENEIEYFQKVLKTKLNIELKEAEIRDVYRVGKKTDTKPRATILEFVRFNTKQEILKNITKFKGTGLSISNDLNFEERHQKKVLYKHYKAAKEKQYQAKIFKNKLIINGETFTYEQLKEQDSYEEADNVIIERENNIDSLQNKDEIEKKEEGNKQENKKNSVSTTPGSAGISASTRSNKKVCASAFPMPPAKKVKK